MKLKLLSAFVLSSLLSFSQVIPEEIKPPSWHNKSLTNVEAYKLPAFDVLALIEEDKINDQNKSIPWRFGKDIFVGHDITTHGQWTTLDNGDKIWRMAYTSEGALSINFLFDSFYLPKGSKLYVYNDEKNDLLRPFTHHNNNDEEILGTWFVQGNKAWIEYYQPAGISGTPRLTVGSVIHGYRSAETFEKGLNDSGPCNQDVDCDITPTGSDPFQINTKKEDVKRASGMVTVNGGTGICSGTLVNNTSNNAIPYFLTANHCSGGEGFWAFRFNWRSPNPSCGTFSNSTNGSFNQTVSGSVVRAASSRSDMELVQINDNFFFSNNSEVVWAGWNRSTTLVPQQQFGVHHPSGDIQKTCRNDEAAFRITTSFNGDPNTAVWRINNWELGVTEPGSSGSGLFDTDGRLIGVLSGGSAACSGTNDNGGFDIYGRFGVAWDFGFGSTSSSRLRDWLDPTNTGATSINTLPNPLSVEEQTLESVVSIYPNPTKGIININVSNTSEKLDYEVINALGQRVMSGKLNTNVTTSLSVADMSAGLYFVKLTSANATMIQKIIKE